MDGGLIPAVPARTGEIQKGGDLGGWSVQFQQSDTTPMISNTEKKAFGLVCVGSLRSGVDCDLPKGEVLELRFGLAHELCIALCNPRSDLESLPPPFASVDP